MVKADDEADWLESEYKAGSEQAKALTEQAKIGGLRFDAFLPPRLAEWALKQVSTGRFSSPSELVFVLLQQVQMIETYAPEAVAVAIDRSLHAASQGSMISGEEYERKVKARLALPIPPAAEWVKSRRQDETD